MAQLPDPAVRDVFQMTSGVRLALTTAATALESTSPSAGRGSPTPMLPLHPCSSICWSTATSTVSRQPIAVAFGSTVSRHGGEPQARLILIDPIAVPDDVRALRREVRCWARP
jgi:hypothetical protein